MKFIKPPVDMPITDVGSFYIQQIIIDSEQQAQRRYYVYVICDPDTLEPFYVGKGTGDRITSSTMRSRNKDVIRKTNELNSVGRPPIAFKYMESLTEEQSIELESHLIHSLGRKGFDENGILYNVQPGRKEHLSEMYSRIFSNDPKDIKRVQLEKMMNPDFEKQFWWHDNLTLPDHLIMKKAA